MSYARSLVFESLEERKLLSNAHVAAAHAKPAAVMTPLVLSGTLTVDSKAASTTVNDDDSTTTSIPVSGQIATLGKVHGIWDESADQFGDYEGPDTIQLRGAKGMVVIAFSNANPGPAYHNGNGSVSYQHPQIFDGGTRAYSRGAESGSIVLTTNAAHNAIASMTLTTTNK
jgi:hypothetical protein